MYSTLDSFFEVRLATKPNLVLQEEEVSRYLWVDVPSVDSQQLAFASGQHALAACLKLFSKKN